MPTTLSSAKRPAASEPLNFILTGVAVIAGLYFGKALIIPLTLALLFSFLLSTPVVWLEKMRFGRPFAVVAVLFIALGIAGSLLWLGIGQLAGIARSLPNYRQNMVHKLEGLRNPAGNGLLGIVNNIDQLRRQFSAEKLRSEKKGEPNEAGAPPSEVTPVPVHVVNDSGAFSLSDAGTSVAQLAADMLAVVVLTLFMLLNRGHLRNRLLRLMGQGQLVLVTTAIDDAASRVSRYLLTQSLVNGSFGLLLWAGLSLIGVPYAPFWGVLVAVLRFIPYVGTFIAGLCPFLLSLIVLEGWRRPLLTLGLYLAIELGISTVLEPWLYATRTGISSLAILISTAFWTLLWGPLGLVLSTPLTVCLAVLGRHLPPFEFLYIMLGDEPVLPEHVRYYQRLLAEDEDEAAQLLETCLREKSLVQVYDTIVVPALSLAESDRHEGRLPGNRAGIVYQAARELVEVAGDRHPVACVVKGGPTEVAIACLGARDEADTVVGAILVQLLCQCGFNAELIDAVPREPKGLLIVSALPPFAIMPARSACRRLRREYPEAAILLGVWGSVIPAANIQERLGSSCADWVVTSLEDALTHITATAAPPLAESA